jgi:hypothetical protein
MLNIKTNSSNLSYEVINLKTYDTRIIQHRIPLKNDVKPFQHKFKVSPSLKPLIQKELSKLLDAKMIF